MESPLQGSTTHPATDGVSECADDVALIPARYWWLKRLSVVGVLLLVAVCVLRIVWGQIAHSRLEAEIESYRAAGQLVYAHEFDAQLDAVPAERNAAVLYEKAMTVMVEMAPDGTQLTAFLPEKVHVDSKLGGVQALMTANAEALRLVREARDKPDAAWSFRHSQTRSTPLLFREQFLLNGLMNFATAYHFHAGDHSAAVACWRDAAALNKWKKSIPAYAGIGGASCDFVADAVWFLEIRDEILDDGIIPAPRHEVQSFLRELIDETPLRRSAVQACLARRAVLIDGLQTRPLARSLGVPDGPILLDIIEYVIGPAVVLDGIGELRASTWAAAALAKEQWSDAMQGHQVRESAVWYVLRFASGSNDGRSDSPFQRNQLELVHLFFRELAERRMAAIAVAIRLYELDHGVRPEELAALVPDYLGELPRDPFDPASGTFRYRPKAARAGLYSVAKDGKDNDMREVFHSVGPRECDIVFYLDPEPASPSSGNAHDKQKQVETEQGQ